MGLFNIIQKIDSTTIQSFNQVFSLSNARGEFLFYVFLVFFFFFYTILLYIPRQYKYIKAYALYYKRGHWEHLGIDLL